MIFSKCSTKLCPDDNIVSKHNHTCQQTFLSPFFFSFCSRGQRWNSGYLDERESLNWGGKLPARKMIPPLFGTKLLHGLSRSAAHCFAPTWSFSDAITEDKNTWRQLQQMLAVFIRVSFWFVEWRKAALICSFFSGSYREISLQSTMEFTWLCDWSFGSAPEQAAGWWWSPWHGQNQKILQV